MFRNLPDQRKGYNQQQGHDGIDTFLYMSGIFGPREDRRHGRDGSDRPDLEGERAQRGKRRRMVGHQLQPRVTACRVDLSSVADLPTGPQAPHSSVLSLEEEAVSVPDLLASIRVTSPRCGSQGVKEWFPNSTPHANHLMRRMFPDSIRIYGFRQRRTSPSPESRSAPHG